MAKKRWAFAGLLICLAFFLMLAGCSRQSQQANSIQIKGSDTMVNLGQAWAEAFMKVNPKVSVAVTGGGSGTGIAALLSNTCDIAELSRELKPEEIAMARQKGFDPKQITVALDGLAVVVHPANPLSQLTMDQLAAIFSGTVTQLEGGRRQPTCRSWSCRARSTPAPTSISRSTCCAAAGRKARWSSPPTP